MGGLLPRVVWSVVAAVLVVHAVATAHAGSASAVAVSHQVGELSFDLGAGGPVVGDPLRMLLLGAGAREAVFVAADADGAPGVGFGAPRAQRAIGAGLAEGGGAVAATVAVDGRGAPVRTGDRVRAEVDVEVGLGEHPARRGGLLGLAPRVDVVVGEVFVELAGAVRVVAVHRRLGRAGRAGPLAVRLGGPTIDGAVTCGAL